MLQLPTPSQAAISRVLRTDLAGADPLLGEDPSDIPGVEGRSEQTAIRITWVSERTFQYMIDCIDNRNDGCVVLLPTSLSE